MGSFHHGLPSFLLDWAAEQGIRSGVETGTLHGNSTEVIADSIGSCTTIEWSGHLADRARARFAGDPRVTVLQGSSAEVLPEVCAALTEPTVFWLDAHYSGGVTAGAEAQCPVLEELDAIAVSADPTQHVVFVDDARLFGFVPASISTSARDQWPSLFSVMSRLEAMGLRTYVVDDVVVGIGPQRVESFEMLRECNDVRQVVVLYPHWRAIWRWIRWSPSGLRRRLPGELHRRLPYRWRRRVKRVVRSVLPRRVRRRLRRLLVR